jgi:hypothetical protein
MSAQGVAYYTSRTRKIAILGLVESRPIVFRNSALLSAMAGTAKLLLQVKRGISVFAAKSLRLTEGRNRPNLRPLARHFSIATTKDGRNADDENRGRDDRCSNARCESRELQAR